MKTNVMTGWDRLAPCYRALETLGFGTALQRARCAWIERLASRQNVLLLGEGDGRFLAEALEVAPDARFTVVDGSEGMLAAAKRRAATDHDRVDFIYAQLPGQVELIRARDSFDAVSAHFFFDCFATDDVVALIESVSRRTTSDAIWLVSDFHVAETPWWKRIPSNFVVGALYRAFRFMTGLRTCRLPSWESAMRASGLTCAINEKQLFGLTRSDVWTRT